MARANVRSDSPDVRIFGFSQSTYCRTVVMTCIEKGVSYELDPVEFGQDSHIALHPFGKIPAARIGGTVLMETLAICTLVDDLFAGPRLQPADAVVRARMLSWFTAAMDYAYPVIVKGAMQEGGLSEEQLERVRHYLTVFDAGLGNGEFLADSPSLSLADLLLFPMLEYFDSRVPNLVGDYESLQRWHLAIRRRASAGESAV